MQSYLPHALNYLLLFLFLLGSLLPSISGDGKKLYQVIFDLAMDHVVRSSFNDCGVFRQSLKSNATSDFTQVIR
jgi:hypothetical protein